MNQRNWFVLSVMVITLLGGLNCLMAAASDLIEFNEWVKIFDRKTFGPDEERDEVGPGYKIGTIRQGPYKGYDLVFAFFSVSTPCKGGPCPYSRNRFAMKGNRLVFFPRISWKYHVPDVVTKFEQYGFDVTVDDLFTIPALEYHPAIAGPEKAQVLFLDIDREEIEFVLTEEPDLSRFKEMFFYEVLGQVFAPMQKTALSRIGWDSAPFSSAVQANRFYVFRPDHTYVIYSFAPPDFHANIIWDGTGESDHWNYTLSIDPCQEDAYQVVFGQQVNMERDLRRSGATPGGDPIYELRAGHPMLQTVYETYEKTREESYRYQPMNAPPLLDKEQFDKSRPLIFWQDPFERLIVALNTQFKIPCFAEPILYLYPTTEKHIHVKLPPAMNITASIPGYQEEWNVLARPTGRLTDLATGEDHARLFWEGWSMLLNQPTKGFVVGRDDVSGFLYQTLPTLGLNAVETEDFVTAWAPRFVSAPFYLISFLEPDVIDELAPLTLDPAPDSVIRVYMDYKPLEEHVAADPIPLPKAPERHGFTMVEWGGLIR